MEFLYHYRHEDGRLMRRTDPFDSEGWHEITRGEHDREQRRIELARTDRLEAARAERDAARAALADRLGITPDELALFGR